MNQSEAQKTHHQVTMRREIRVEGVGLHSGKSASVLLRPALPNTGVLFIRTDLDPTVAIPATFEYVTQTKLATTIGRGAVQVSTVEHLLSAFKLLGIDNAVVEVDGPEVPIMDGSSMAFCEAILAAGFYDQAVAKQIAVLKKRVEVRKGDKLAVIEPSDHLQIKAHIEWAHPAIRSQKLNFTLGKNDFREIANARTFGFLKDVEMLKKMGLARGGSLSNAIVLDEARVINTEGLRHADEFVRHKVLDAIGDFALSPIPFVGLVTLEKAGHEIHKDLVAAIFSDPNNYEIKTLEGPASAKVASSEKSDFSWIDANLQGAY
jgi:UDP-3-O-[3-hydroxymyristoyl] N-acetylglucosamine deacetylase